MINQSYLSGALDERVVFFAEVYFFFFGSLSEAR
ncbi:MAG: hypothetical protein ACI9NQ_000923 [Paracoccaceae bacterium]|jgi:hypothetical protein